MVGPRVAAQLALDIDVARPRPASAGPLRLEVGPLDDLVGAWDVFRECAGPGTDASPCPAARLAPFRAPHLFGPDGGVDADLVVFVGASRVGCSPGVAASARRLTLDPIEGRPQSAAVNLCPGDREGDDPLAPPTTLWSPVPAGEVRSGGDVRDAQVLYHEIVHAMARRVGLRQRARPRGISRLVSLVLCVPALHRFPSSSRSAPIPSALLQGVVYSAVSTWQRTGDADDASVVYGDPCAGLPGSQTGPSADVFPCAACPPDPSGAQGVSRCGGLALRGSDGAAWLATPRVVAWAAAASGCSSVPGARLEDGGGGGTRLSHWEGRMFDAALMSATSSVRGKALTDLELAALADTGWWLPAPGLVRPMGLLEAGAARPFDVAPGCGPSLDGQCRVASTTGAGDGGVPGAPSHIEPHCPVDFDSAVSPSEPDRDPPSVWCGWDLTYFGPCLPLTDGRCGHPRPVGVAGLCAEWGSRCLQRARPDGGRDASCVAYSCDDAGELWVDLGGRGAGGGRRVRCPAGVWVDAADGAVVADAYRAAETRAWGPCPSNDYVCGNLTCPNDCGGPARGRCLDGTCVCWPGHAGDDCLIDADRAPPRARPCGEGGVREQAARLLSALGAMVFR